MEKLIMDEILKGFLPTVFPVRTTQAVQSLFDELEKSFKQPIKQSFPYPIDIIKYVNPTTKKLHKLVFSIALAGIYKDEIKVQLKKGKFLSIAVNPLDRSEDCEGCESEYISKLIAYRSGEISFRLFNEIDMDRFKPTFANGLLTIEIYVKEKEDEDDVLNITID
jgi:HSP20 family molecular chaperone IbpA